MENFFIFVAIEHTGHSSTSLHNVVIIMHDGRFLVLIKRGTSQNWSAQLFKGDFPPLSSVVCTAQLT